MLLQLIEGGNLHLHAVKQMMMPLTTMMTKQAHGQGSHETWQWQVFEVHSSCLHTQLGWRERWMMLMQKRMQ